MKSEKKKTARIIGSTSRPDIKKVVSIDDMISHKKHRKPSNLLIKSLLDAIEIRPSIMGVGINLSTLSRKINSKKHKEIIEEKIKSLEEKKIEIIKQLLESDIDPKLFDVLIQNELDRRLKVRFGITFLLLTFIFTTASYCIVIFDGIYRWNISEIAITALIIETPIQFIGILYIIARNLFPQNKIDIDTNNSV
jgi:hypothetical protein